ncbi:hypothetical protein XELAEV_18008701mg, partial [Xenopus laevis]
IKEINKNPIRLPNVTLGYHIYDSCGSTQRALISLLKILSGTSDPVPNYSCLGMRKVIGFIGDLDTEPTVSMAYILNVLGYSQISYGATDPSLSDRATFPYFFRTVQSDEEEFIALCKLLNYFGWTWVGIIYFDDYSGYRDHQMLLKYLSSEGICVEFTIKLKQNIQEYEIHKETIKTASSGVVIICGDFNYASESPLYYISATVSKKTCIFLSKWLNHVDGLESTAALVSGSLSFMQNRLNNPLDAKFRGFSDSFNPSIFPHDKLLAKLWMYFLYCLSKDEKTNIYFMWDFNIYLHNCSGKEKLTDISEYLNSYHSANVIQAVDIMVMALEDMHNSQTSEKKTWMDNHNQIPRAQCSDNCFPGYRKVPKPGAQSCCYDCIPCPEGEISNTTGINILLMHFVIINAAIDNTYCTHTCTYCLILLTSKCHKVHMLNNIEELKLQT